MQLNISCNRFGAGDSPKISFDSEPNLDYFYLSMRTTLKSIRISAAVLTVLVLLWILFMVLSSSMITSEWTASDYLNWASAAGVPYLLNYINATLLTAVVLFLFAFLYMYLRDKYPAGALSGLLFVPVYGTLNLVCYSIQITMVPSLAGQLPPDDGTLLLASQLIQVDPGSLVGYLNGLAYAILGIPSILYGRLLAREGRKYSGFFLLLNGILCIIGLIGYISGIGIISTGVMAGGFVFLVSLVCMLFEFRNK